MPSQLRASSKGAEVDASHEGGSHGHAIGKTSRLDWKWDAKVGCHARGIRDAKVGYQADHEHARGDQPPRSSCSDKAPTYDGEARFWWAMAGQHEL